MIGSDEFVAHDKHWSTMFVGSRQGRDAYLEQAKADGFEVEGARVLATQDETRVPINARLLAEAHRMLGSRAG